MILCIGTTPALQRVMVFPKLTLDAVNRAVKTLDGVAGKSVNVVKVLRTLGEEAVAVGFLGGERGEHLRRVLVAKGIDLDFVRVEPATRQCMTVVDEGAGTITELVEESSAVSGQDYEQLSILIRRRVRSCRAMVMSGTLTPGGPVDFYRRCAEVAHEFQALTAVDAQGAPLTEVLRARPGLVKPNRSELASTTGRTLKDEAAVIDAMRELHARGAQRVVVTAGKEPALALDGRQIWRIASPRIKALNPIGSGDAFTAALVWRLVRGDDLGEACRWGAAAGAANALTWMAGEAEREEIELLAREVRVEGLLS